MTPTHKVIVRLGIVAGMWCECKVSGGRCFHYNCTSHTWVHIPSLPCLFGSCELKGKDHVSFCIPRGPHRRAQQVLVAEWGNKLKGL